MLLTSLNGRRQLHVAPTTRDRVIDHITQNHGKTTIEYAEATLVSEVVINLIIEVCLLPLAASGAIAVSYYGRKPDWFWLAGGQNVVPVRKIKRRVGRPTLRDITDRQLRLDYIGLVTSFDRFGHRLSPARRDAARRNFIDRVNHVGSSHQSSTDLIVSVRNEMHGMKEAIQVMASALTNSTIKVA